MYAITYKWNPKDKINDYNKTKTDSLIDQIVVTNGKGREGGVK